MKWIFLNHSFLPEEEAVLHVSDLSIQRGYGVFDYLKIINNEPIFLNEHLHRLEYSANELGLSLNISQSELQTIIEELISRNKMGTSGIRLTLTGGYSKDGYTISDANLIIQQQALTLPDADAFKKGIKLVTYEHVRQLPHVKSINYLMGIWLQKYIQQNQANDVLYHWNGIISECPRANIFIVTHNDILVTPSQNILKGITRQKLLHLASGFMQCEEREINRDELYNCKEAFITSTTKQVMPVTAVDSHIINHGTPGRVAHTLLDLLHQAQMNKELAQ